MRQGSWTHQDTLVTSAAVLAWQPGRPGPIRRYPTVLPTTRRDELLLCRLPTLLGPSATALGRRRGKERGSRRGAPRYHTLPSCASAHAMVLARRVAAYQSMDDHQRGPMAATFQKDIPHHCLVLRLIGFGNGLAMNCVFNLHPLAALPPTQIRNTRALVVMLRIPSYPQKKESFAVVSGTAPPNEGCTQLTSLHVQNGRGTVDTVWQEACPCHHREFLDSCGIVVSTGPVLPLI